MATPGPEYVSAVGAALRAVREASGLSQRTLSLAAGLGREQVQRFEAGTSVPDLKQLAAIMETIGRTATRRTNIVTAADLLCLAEGKIEIITASVAFTPTSDVREAPERSRTRS